MENSWEEDFAIRVKCVRGVVVVSANREGLLSLARQFAELAEAAPGSHIHYDEHNSLEEGSTEMTVERTP